MSDSSGVGFDIRKEPAVTTGPRPQPDVADKGSHQRTNNPDPSNLSIVEQIADVVGECFPPGTYYRVDIQHVDIQHFAAVAARALADAGLLVTDDELEMRRILAEAERPDMQALADRAIELSRLTRAVVDAAIKTYHSNSAEVLIAVDAYLAANGDAQ